VDGNAEGGVEVLDAVVAVVVTVVAVVAVVTVVSYDSPRPSGPSTETVRSRDGAAVGAALPPGKRLAGDSVIGGEVVRGGGDGAGIVRSASVVAETAAESAGGTLAIPVGGEKKSFSWPCVPNCVLRLSGSLGPDSRAKAGVLPLT
jgi:hypothetical protein